MEKKAIVAAWMLMPSAERDAWVHRTVFPEITMYQHHQDCCPACGYDGLWSFQGWDFGPAAEVYTQHAAAAWLVVQRMQERGFVWAAGNAPDSSYWARFATVEQCQARMDEYADQANEQTLPSAIGLAALLALNGGETNGPC